MARITFSKPYDRKNPTDTEMRLRIEGTQSGAIFEFTVNRHSIDVVLRQGMNHPQNHGKRIDVDWFDPRALTDQEKVQLFAAIMDKYRERSFGDAGFRGAAIGAVDAKKNGQTRLFIGTNTQRWASPYFKDCAEQNMVNSATDVMAFERNMHSAVNGSTTPTIPAKLKALYVMQGINDHKAPLSCACGKCTDMLAAGVMEDEAPVVTIPLLTKALKQSILTDASCVEVNTTAQTINDVAAPLASGKCIAWQVPISRINNKRVIRDLNSSVDQDGALKALIKDATSEYGWAEDRGRAAKQSIETWRARKAPKLSDSPLILFASLIEKVGESAKGVTKKIKALISGFEEAANHAVDNVIRSRRSEAALDGAVGNDGTIDLGKINAFLYDQIRDTLADRFRTIPGMSDMPTRDKKPWVEKNIRAIRCVVIQLDSKGSEPGSFYYALQADSTMDKAMPNAGVVALENAVASLGTHRVKHVWAMELNTNDVAENTLHTSPKEEVERLCKRGAKDIDFTYIPLNSGKLSNQEVAQIAKSYGMAEMYPGGYVGQPEESRRQYTPRTRSV